ncbi:MAG: hypothetical protein KA765_09415, partial [Thermoflexales bacterium]|nr:hypothetical protein [Thermoflexales bacterium]
MYHKPRLHLRRSFVLILCLATLLIALNLGSLLPAAANVEAAQQIQQAWQLAQRSGTYRFATDIVQTTYPAPALANVGRSPREDTLHVEGEIDQPARAMTLSLWNNGGSVANADEAIQVRVDGDKSYGRTGTGDWQPIDDVSSAFAPGNDVLAYFAGARNVRSISDASTSDRAGGDLPIADRVGQHLAFDVDGVAFGNYLRDQLEKELSAQGRLPAGLSLDLSSQYRGVLGSGEVWLDADGFPQRLAVNIAFPEQASGERVEAQIQTDFANFNRERIAQATTPTQTMAGLIASLPLPRSAQDWQSIGISALAIASTLAFVTLMILQRRSRLLYTALSLVFIFAIVFSPLMQATQVYAFSADLAAQNAQVENNQLVAQAEHAAQTQLATTNWNPHADPLASNVQPLSSNFQLPTSNLQLQTAATPAPTSDTDLDGLTYAQETLLGTDPDRADTDGDSLQDGVEARGFAYGNQTWYLNPLDPDTNVDNLVDGEECGSA